MSEWTPVARGKIDVLGVNREMPECLQLSVALVGTIQREWAQFFLHPADAPANNGRPAPSLSGGSVRISPRDDEIEVFVRDIDSRIASANAQYERDVLVPLRQEQKLAADAKSAEDERIAAARRVIAEL